MADAGPFAGFEWDTGNRRKCRAHGMAKRDIESLFDEDRPVVILPDVGHSEDERRFRAIGQTHTGRYAFVVFTVRTKAGQRYIRPLSARYMHRKEVAHYEKENPDLQHRPGGGKFRG